MKCHAPSPQQRPEQEADQACAAPHAGTATDGPTQQLHGNAMVIEAMVPEVEEPSPLLMDFGDFSGSEESFLLAASAVQSARADFVVEHQPTRFTSDPGGFFKENLPIFDGEMKTYDGFALRAPTIDAKAEVARPLTEAALESAKVANDRLFAEGLDGPEGVDVEALGPEAAALGSDETARLSGQLAVEAGPGMDAKVADLLAAHEGTRIAIAKLRARAVLEQTSATAERRQEIVETIALCDTLGKTVESTLSGASSAAALVATSSTERNGFGADPYAIPSAAGDKAMSLGGTAAELWFAAELAQLNALIGSATSRAAGLSSLAELQETRVNLLKYQAAGTGMHAQTQRVDALAKDRRRAASQHGTQSAGLTTFALVDEAGLRLDSARTHLVGAREAAWAFAGEVRSFAGSKAGIAVLSDLRGQQEGQAAFYGGAGDKLRDAVDTVDAERGRLFAARMTYHEAGVNG